MNHGTWLPMGAASHPSGIFACLLADLCHDRDPFVDVSLRVGLARLGEERFRDNPWMMAGEEAGDAVVTHSPLNVLRSDAGGVLQVLQAETRLIEPDPLL